MRVNSINNASWRNLQTKNQVNFGQYADDISKNYVKKNASDRAFYCLGRIDGYVMYWGDKSPRVRVNGDFFENRSDLNKRKYLGFLEFDDIRENIDLSLEQIEAVASSAGTLLSKEKGWNTETIADDRPSEDEEEKALLQARLDNLAQ